MKLFVSWSGEVARLTAERLGDWLMRLFPQGVDVFVSSKDIEKGDRWSERLTAVLKDYNVGIVVLNKTNKDRPWINFEAGALSKGVVKGQLIPLLCGLTPGDLLESPLGQFQGVDASRSGLLELAKAINDNQERPLEEVALAESFDVWWEKKGNPVVEASLSAVGPEQKAEPDISARDLMARIDRSESVIMDGLVSLLHRVMAGNDLMLSRQAEVERRALQNRDVGTPSSKGTPTSSGDLSMEDFLAKIRFKKPPG